MYPILLETDLFGLLYKSFAVRAGVVLGIGGVFAIALAAYQAHKKQWASGSFVTLGGVVGIFLVLAYAAPREPWALHSYGVLIAIGFLLAMLLASRRAEVEGEDPDIIIDLAFYVLLTGLVGARIVFIITKLPEYMEDPLRIVRFWQGGLVWYGGFIGAALYVAYYCKKHRLPFLKYADIIVPYMAMAHAFGRLGCLAAGCCFGRYCALPWGIVYPRDSMAHQAQHNAGEIGYMDAALPVHPTPLYEFAGEMALFGLLVLLRRNKRFDGQLFLIWLSVYPVLRSVIELFRGDKARGVYILSTSQWISILVAGAAVALYLHLRKSRGVQETSAAESAA